MKIFNYMIKTFVLTVVLIGNGIFSQDFDVDKEYDKFNKLTTITLDEKLIVNASKGSFNLVSYVSYQYNDIDTTYWWYFKKYTDIVVNPTKQDKITLLIDDELITKYPQKAEIDISTMIVIYYVSVERTLLKKIANSKKTEVQVMNKDFIFEGIFKEADAKILKDFLKYY